MLRFPQQKEGNNRIMEHVRMDTWDTLVYMLYLRGCCTLLGCTCTCTIAKGKVCASKCILNKEVSVSTI